MKIAVMTDVHANLPALQVALGAIQKEGCDEVYHTGDAIGIGPYPAETVNLLLNTPDIRLLMGNHDFWFVHGLPAPQPSWMSDGEAGHQHWVHSCLDPSLRSTIAQWPYVIQEEFEGVRLTFLHYVPADTASGFAPTLHDLTPDGLDALFAQYEADIAFYGHNHFASDVVGRARYVNLGSLGCYKEPVARFVVLECAKGAYTLEKRAVPYEDKDLFAAFEQRQVPERDFICRTFFGGRNRRV
ncbi:MAG: metallophosphoesterase family protein [Chloroflexi bacterium]|nr:metallophosphoesterase family protein [Chloroflexota bacterium]